MATASAGDGSGAAGPTSAQGRRIQVDAGAVQQFLAAAPLFAGLDGGSLAKIAQHLSAVEFPASAVMISAGAPARWMGLLFRGRASVQSVNAATFETKLVEMLRPGDHFGEIGPLCGVAQPHMVTAEEVSQVLCLSVEAMDTLGARLPSFTHALAKRLGMRVLQLSMMALRGASAGRETARPRPAARQATAEVIRFVETTEFDVSPKVVATIPEQLIVRDRMLPLQVQGNSLVVGMVEPNNPAARADLQRVLHNMDLEVVAISADDYEAYIKEEKEK